MAFITGGIAGITLKGTREEYSDYSDFKIFSEDFGLYDEDEPEVKEKEIMPEEKIQQPQSMEKVREQNRSEKQLKDDVI